MTPIPVCGKGTRRGAVAQAARFLFAPCVLPVDHAPPCDSGPIDDDDEPLRAA